MNSRQFEYRRELDALRFTDRQKELLARRISAAAEKPAAARRRGHPVRRLALMSAAAALALAVGAGAAGGLKPVTEAFSGVFSGTAQTEIIDRIGRPIGASDTSGGVTITADAIIGDRYNACIVYTISRDDGTALLPEGVTAENLAMGGFGGSELSGMDWVHGSKRFLPQTDDRCVQMVETVSFAGGPLKQGTAVTAKFQDLSVWDPDTAETEVVAKGSWKLKFRANYEDLSVCVGNGETFSAGGRTYTIDSVAVSPVGVRVAYTVDQEARWSGAPSGQLNSADAQTERDFLESVEIHLTKTDGTVIDLTNSGGSISPRNGVTVCTKDQVFDEILPLEELESVSVGGVTYPVDQAGSGSAAQ